MVSTPPRRPVLDQMVGSREDGQDVRITGSDGPVAVSAVQKLWVSPWILVPIGAAAMPLDANDAFGDTITFDVGTAGGNLPLRGRILTIKMVDQDDDTLAATIHIFNAVFTAAASDAAFTISVADANKWVTSEIFDAGTDIGSAKVHIIKNVNVDYSVAVPALYAQLSTTGTPNIASAAVMPLVKLYILPLD